MNKMITELNQATGVGTEKKKMIIDSLFDYKTDRFNLISGH